MRLPGLAHTKHDKPWFISTLVKCDAELRYTWEEILDAFPPVETKHAITANVSPSGLREQLQRGIHLHGPIRSLAMQYTRHEIPATEIYAALADTLKRSDAANPEHERHEDWQAEFNDLERSISTAFESRKQPKAFPVFDVNNEDFPIHCFPPVMREFIEEVAEIQQQDIHIVAAATLGTAATVVQNKTFFYIRGTTHKNFPNLIFAIVTRMSGRKSTLVSLTVEPINRIQEILDEQDAKEIAKALSRKETAQIKYNGLKQALTNEMKKAATGTVASTEELERKLDEQRQIIKQPIPVARRIREPSNSTNESLIRSLLEQDGKTSIHTTELSVFSRLVEGAHMKKTGTNGSALLLASVNDEIDLGRTGISKTERVVDAIRETAMSGVLAGQRHVYHKFSTNPDLKELGLPSRIHPAYGSDNIDRLAEQARKKAKLRPLDSSKTEPFYNRCIEIYFGQPFGEDFTTQSKEWQELEHWTNIRLAEEWREYYAEASKFTTMTVRAAIVLKAFAKTTSIEQLDNAKQVMFWYTQRAFEQEHNNKQVYEYASALKILKWITKDTRRFERYQEHGFKRSDVINALRNTKLRDDSEIGLDILSVYDFITVKYEGKSTRCYLNFTKDNLMSYLGDTYAELYENLDSSE
jgi:hypothetical protein